MGKEFPVSDDDSPVGFFKITDKMRAQMDQADAERSLSVVEQNNVLAQGIVVSPFFIDAVRRISSRCMDEDALRNYYLERVIGKLDSIAESLKVRVKFSYRTLDRERLRKILKEKA